MNNDIREKLSWRDRSVAVILLLIGILFLALQTLSIISSRADSYSVQQNAIVMNKAELFNDLRIYITIIAGIASGILLFRRHRWGWVLGLPILVLFLLLCAWGVRSAAAMHQNLSLALSLAGCLILLLATLHLLSAASRKKFRAGKTAWLPTLVFLSLLTVLYFVLQ